MNISPSNRFPNKNRFPVSFDYFADFQKIFEEKMFTRTPSTTLFQIFCELMHYSKIIFKSMTGPDDTGQVDLQARMG